MTNYLNRPDRLSLITLAAAKVTGKRFCAHHQGQVLASEGNFVMRNKTRRWICYRCQQHSARQCVVLEREGDEMK